MAGSLPLETCQSPEEQRVYEVGERLRQRPELDEAETADLAQWTLARQAPVLSAVMARIHVLWRHWRNDAELDISPATGLPRLSWDRAGQSLRPPKARTWARRGQTPVVKVSGKGSGPVSIAGLVCVRPGSRSRLLYRMRVHRGRKGERRSMSEADYAGLITAAHQQLHAPVILIWDNLNTHISAMMRAFTESHPGWLTVVRLPACAPDLNPAQGVWANMKTGLGNLAVSRVDQLTAVVRNRLKRIQYRPALIDGFLAQTGLTLEPEPP
jgi:putative transposase